MTWFEDFEFDFLTYGEDLMVKKTTKFGGIFGREYRGRTCDIHLVKGGALPTELTPIYKI